MNLNAWTTVTFNPENWVHEEATVEVSPDGMTWHQADRYFYLKAIPNDDWCLPKPHSDFQGYHIRCTESDHVFGLVGRHGNVEPWSATKGETMRDGDVPWKAAAKLIACLL